jgi:hypothetical protein
MSIFVRHLMALWFLLAIFLSWEYLALNWALKYSLLNYMKLQLSLSAVNLSTEPGRPISYWLGWGGFGVMCLTNIYIARKRLPLMHKWGRLRNWLEFHIFCGLVGPTLIIFHSDFKVKGLVAVSFWSMMIAAGSGVLGRYFYLQTSRENKSLRGIIEQWEKKIAMIVEKSGKTISPQAVVNMKAAACTHVGVRNPKEEGEFQPLLPTIYSSIRGDIRLFFNNPQYIGGLPPQTGDVLCAYALAVRQESYLTQFERLLGYWHTFHVPFTITMYITAIIHIVVALMFLSG